MLQTGTTTDQGEVVVKGLTKRYDSVAAVNNVSLRAAPGEFVSLIGPSGSGKTTTLMMIAGFVHPDEGAILLDGTDISRMIPQKRQLGMVFQNYAIFPHMTVFENVAFPLRVRKMSREKIRQQVDWALKVVKLDRFADRYSRQLSGGQQQRVALARAIVFQPRIILMDEPLGALDKNLRYHMQVELKELQQRLNTTVIYVTHDQEEAMNMSDKIVVMNDGMVEQFGAPAEVYNRPSTTFVAKFLGEANLLPVHIVGHLKGTARVALPGGHQISASSGTKADGPAQLFIRPEKVNIQAADRARVADTGDIVGKLTRVSFLGNIVRYVVLADDQSEVVIDRQNSRDAPSLALGDHVSLSFDPRDATVLAR